MGDCTTHRGFRRDVFIGDTFRHRATDDVPYNGQMGGAEKVSGNTENASLKIKIQDESRSIRQQSIAIEVIKVENIAKLRDGSRFPLVLKGAWSDTAEIETIRLKMNLSLSEIVPYLKRC
jgi:hypothetical protein